MQLVSLAAALNALAALLLLITVYLQLRLTARLVELHSTILSDLLDMMRERVGETGNKTLD